MNLMHGVGYWKLLMSSGSLYASTVGTKKSNIDPVILNANLALLPDDPDVQAECELKYAALRALNAKRLAKVETNMALLDANLSTGVFRKEVKTAGQYRGVRKLEPEVSAKPVLPFPFKTIDLLPTDEAKSR
jgi:hypothetical protein